MRSTLRACCLLALAAPAAGCMFFTTKKEGEILERRVRRLSSAVGRMEKQEKATVERLKQASAELKELKEILPKARQILLRSSARFGLRLDKLASDVDKLKGKVDSLAADQAAEQKTVAALKTEAGSVQELVGRIKTELTRLIEEVRKSEAQSKPKTSAEHYARATIARLAGKYPEARRDYRQVIQKFPKDRRAEAARYFLAKTYFDAFDFKQAIVVLAKLLKTHPRGRYAARARLLSARSYFELKRCMPAISILERLIKQFPDAEVTPQARGLLARLKRIQNISRYCTR